MLSKNKIKLIQSLNRKKNRDESGFFLVEGNKMVEEAIQSDFTIEMIVCIEDFARQHLAMIGQTRELIICGKDELSKASLLQHPQDALAIVNQPITDQTQINLQGKLSLVLDSVQDPGNLGTIIRLADWYGIDYIFCSENTVDVFNPKVVQASMGSVFRVQTRIMKLTGIIMLGQQAGLPIYGTFLEGENIYTQDLTPNGMIVLGNEGNGISGEISRLITHQLYIPCFSQHSNKPESLNVATAAAICCSEFRRR